MAAHEPPIQPERASSEGLPKAGPEVSWQPTVELEPEELPAAAGDHVPPPLPPPGPSALDVPRSPPVPEHAPDPPVRPAEAEPPTAKIVRPRRFRIGQALRGMVAFLASMLVHLVGAIVMAVWMVPPPPAPSTFALVVNTTAELEELESAELETVVLDEQREAATRLSFAVSSGDPSMGVSSVAAAQSDEVRVDDTIQDPLASLHVEPGGLESRAKGKTDLLAQIPQGNAGTAREVVDGYEEAIDRITRELMLLLQESKVLAIWCFDQSESMKDDQKEIRDRIERVYSELGLSDQAAGDALTTAVVSYGEHFLTHTKLPTSDRDAIRKAIDAVPSDPSGKELMCQAVGSTISLYRNYAVKARRRMALILVTDESGEPEDNLRYLEPTIAMAQAARCKVYVLGREAVFGYPYAYIRFIHPQTKRHHWLRVDRGPETGFVEQLQTDGFHRRYDAHPSGFGPYEQSRMALETGGIFFLLPSVESNLVRGEKRRYELEAMRDYLPDLRAREEVLFERKRGKLRTMVWTVICDLNPYNKQSARVIELRVEFSIQPAELVRQVAVEQEKAKVFITYLEEAFRQLEKIAPLRDQEESPRWRANYDLICAQLLAYKVRLYEYIAGLDAFVKKPKVVPLKKAPNLTLTHWDIGTRKETLTGAKTAKDVERATAMFDKVIETYPGTPWAARAQWELRRGFGVDLFPDYEPPYPKVTNPSPLPKL